MIRRILVWLRNFIDRLLYKTSRYPKYTIYGNTFNGNTYSLLLTSANDFNTVYNGSIANSASNGIWLTDGS